VALELHAEGNEGLDIAAAADDLDDDVQADTLRTFLTVLRGWWEFRLGLCGLQVGSGLWRYEERQRSAEARFEVDVDAAIVCSMSEE
jgi:hypothetical protein